LSTSRAFRGADAFGIKHIADYLALAKRIANPAGFAAGLNERKERAAYYQSWDKVVADNDRLPNLLRRLSDLIWSEIPLDQR
jgi:hypothetical protein